VHRLRLADLDPAQILDRGGSDAGCLVVGCNEMGVGEGAAAGIFGRMVFLTLASTSSLVPLQDMVAEHRIYLPLAAMVTLANFRPAVGNASLGRALILSAAPESDRMLMRSRFATVSD
jgi:hypothetical protein